MKSRLLALLLALPCLPVAAEDGALELVMFDQTHCEWCEQWDEDIGGIYAKTEEGRAAPLRRVDIHGERPDDLKDIRGVAFTPTFVLVRDGEETGRIAGYPGPDFFWPMLEQLLDDVTPPETD